MNKNELKACSYCLNAYVDDELNSDNDFSSIHVGRAGNGYRMSIDSGDGKSTMIVVTHWNEKRQRNENVAIYKMKYCPECGRKLIENEE